MRPELRRITLKFLQTYGICGVIRVWVVSAEARSSSKFADEFSNIYACFFGSVLIVYVRLFIHSLFRLSIDTFKIEY